MRTMKTLKAFPFVVMMGILSSFPQKVLSLTPPKPIVDLPRRQNMFSSPLFLNTRQAPPPAATSTRFVERLSQPGLGMTISIQEERTGDDPDTSSLAGTGSEALHSMVATNDDILGVETESSSAATSNSLEILWQRIVRRLNTHEDYLGMHKVSSITWLVTSIGMLGTGISNGFSEIPSSLQVPTWLFLASSVLQSMTGIHMALKYRDKDPAVQKGFINMSLALVNLAYTCVYFSPFATELSNEYWIGNGLFILTILPLVFLGTDEVLNLATKMNHRRIRNKEPSVVDFGTVGDVLSYGLVVFAGFIGATAGLLFAADPVHDRTWLLNAAAPNVFGSPHYLAENYFSSILYNLGVGFGALAITLRDKKLISKTMEQTMVAAFVIPGVYLNLHSLASF